MTFGNMSRLTNLEAITSEIASLKPTLIVFENLYGVYSAHEVYTIKNGSNLSIMVGNSYTGYKSLSDMLEEKMVFKYGFLNG